MWDYSSKQRKYGVLHMRRRESLANAIILVILFFALFMSSLAANPFIGLLRSQEEPIFRRFLCRSFCDSSVDKSFAPQAWKNFSKDPNPQSPPSLLLLSLDWTRPKDPPMSLGHASLLANLHYHNVNAIPGSWAVNSPNFSPQQVTDFIMSRSNAGVDVALGVFVWNERAIQSILNDLKRYKFPGRIILGGPQVSYVKKGLEAFYPQADVFIRGYAEDALVKLVQMKQYDPVSPIKGVHYTGLPDLATTAMVDLESIPSPFLTGLISPQPFIRWETQRGCPFRCSFCQHREPNVTMKRRQFSLSRIMQEVEWIANNPIIQDIAVLDPTFNSCPNYLAIMDKLISERFSGKISLQCRIEMVTEDFLNKIGLAPRNRTGGLRKFSL